MGRGRDTAAVLLRRRGCSRSGSPMKSSSVRELLKHLGLRATIPRCLIIDALQTIGHPVSHLELAEHLADAEIDLSTVFRNLVALADAGLVRRIELGDRIWRYEWIDPASGTDGHPHFVCSQCGQILCLADDGPIRLSMTPSSLQIQDVILRGLCAECQPVQHDAAE